MYFNQRLLSEQQAFDTSRAFQAKGPGKSIVLTGPAVTQRDGITYRPPVRPVCATDSPAKVLPEKFRAFAAQKATEVRRHYSDKVTWLPDWVRTFIASDPSPAARIQEILRRVKDSPTEVVLLEAQALLNELGRDAETAKLVKQAVTKEFIHQITSKH